MDDEYSGQMTAKKALNLLNRVKKQEVEARDE
jgi:hypothetical protein